VFRVMVLGERSPTTACSRRPSAAADTGRSAQKRKERGEAICGRSLASSTVS
jgi:hypothetical protein